MKEFYTPAETSEITGASKPALRNYTIKYGEYFSPTATPAAGESRRYTVDDLRLIMFIRDQTMAKNVSHDSVGEALRSGALSDFDWQPPEQPEPESEPADRGPGEYLVPLARLQAAEIVLHDAQAREQTAIAKVETLQSRVNELERELGIAQGRVAELHRPWWHRVLGIRSD